MEDERKISRAQGEKFANENGLLFIECSAKIGENVDYVFNKLVSILLQNNPESKEFSIEFENLFGKQIKKVEEKYAVQIYYNEKTNEKFNNILLK